ARPTSSASSPCRSGSGARGGKEILARRMACLRLLSSVSRPVWLVAASPKVHTPRMRGIRRAKSQGVAETLARLIHFRLPEVVKTSRQGCCGSDYGGAGGCYPAPPRLGRSRGTHVLPSARRKDLDAAA